MKNIIKALYDYYCGGVGDIPYYRAIMMFGLLVILYAFDFLILTGYDITASRNRGEFTLLFLVIMGITVWAIFRTIPEKELASYTLEPSTYNLYLLLYVVLLAAGAFLPFIPLMIERNKG